MLMGDERLNGLTEKIIGCAFKVGAELGAGFLEKVYENALAHELRKAGLRVEQQHPVPVWYDGELVGEFFTDLLIEGTIVVELKAVRAFDDIHYAQCINYLAATKLPICLLINFGRSVQIKRFMGGQAKPDEVSR